ncbi:hypothetical protein F7725_011787 [Dissostichus mawsoni]|uniref:Uncharacterized protein n=1 Tax=Dissostichus mawsoni TaxID=36200 RepID=A0A7J5ZA72_DISMA|nr:hypothetical protein F7725_011787 [Dissostichus mawsoni]
MTPVYPMEKMVANKLILHNNCFCCKHCKKSSASTTILLFMGSATAFLTTNSFLKDQEIMMRDLGISNIKTAGFRKIKK